MDAGVLILVAIVLLFIWYFHKPTDFENHYEYFIAHDANGGEYQIHLDMPRPESAVNKLSKLNGFIVRAINGMYNRYGHRNDLPIHKDVAERLKKDYRPGELFEQRPNDGSITSFVTNKGERVTFCLRQAENLNFHDDHLLNFVALHEISHIGTKSLGHHHEFWRNFRIVLECAMLDGIHHPKNYFMEPTYYCGKLVNYTPLYDTRLDYVSVLGNRGSPASSRTERELS